uniref:Uncharacterized protein n=1 Tax=Anopheles farauti TaxID=69004 RepID=A0A182Q8J7_9DIPT
MAPHGPEVVVRMGWRVEEEEVGGFSEPFSATSIIVEVDTAAGAAGAAITSFIAPKAAPKLKKTYGEVDGHQPGQTVKQLKHFSNVTPGKGGGGLWGLAGKYGSLVSQAPLKSFVYAKSWLESSINCWRSTVSASKPPPGKRRTEAEAFNKNRFNDESIMNGAGYLLAIVVVAAVVVVVVVVVVGVGLTVRLCPRSSAITLTASSPDGGLGSGCKQLMRLRREDGGKGHRPVERSKKRVLHHRTPNDGCGIGMHQSHLNERADFGGDNCRDCSGSAVRRSSLVISSHTRL